MDTMDTIASLRATVADDAEYDMDIPEVELDPSDPDYAEIAAWAASRPCAS